MNIEVTDLRKGDRFLVVEPLTGSFGPAEVAVVNLSLGGVQLTHPQPVRIGTRAKLWFRRGDVSVTITATLVWSHFAKTSTGMVYVSGARLDGPDPQFALAVNTLLRTGVLRQDADSLEKKKQRLREREEARKSLPRLVPTSEPPPA